MAEENTTEKTDSPNEAKPPKDFKKLIMPVLAFLNVAAVSASLFMVYSSTMGYESPLKSEEDFKRELASYKQELSEGSSMYTFDQFNANLGGRPKRLVKFTVSLEMMSKGDIVEITDLSPGARDKILKLVGDKTFYELEGVQGKLQLKNEIAAEVNDLLTAAVVKDVYFSNFVLE